MAKKEKLYYDDSGTSFKEAFASARSEGKKTFEWNGEKYTTALKSEKKKPESERDLSESPRISDMKKVRDEAVKRSNEAEERKDIVYKQEQARLADLAKRGVVPEKEMATSRSRLSAVNKTSDREGDEFMRREMMLQRDAEARGEGMKKGGEVKKYNSGGTATSKPEPKKDTMPEWAKNERANRKQDELNKREAEGAAKEVKRNMSTFGFKHGGSASSRADGIAQRGKTRGRIY